nr:proline-rich proteoglycan 2-like [Aegilops tauschii subsp. strangulata]
MLPTLSRHGTVKHAGTPSAPPPLSKPLPFLPAQKVAKWKHHHHAHRRPPPPGRRTTTGRAEPPPHARDGEEPPQPPAARSRTPAAAHVARGPRCLPGGSGRLGEARTTAQPATPHHAPPCRGAPRPPSMEEPASPPSRGGGRAQAPPAPAPVGLSPAAPPGGGEGGGRRRGDRRRRDPGARPGRLTGGGAGGTL